MALRIPTYDENVQLRPRGNTPVRVQASGSDGGVGAAMQRVGQGIGNFADAMTARKGVEAEAEAREGVTAFRNTLREGLYDPETGYLTQEGKNALGESRQNTVQTLEEERGRIRESLSPLAQQTYDQMTTSLMNTAQDKAIVHEGGALKDYTYGQLAASAQGYIDDALLNPGNSEEFTRNVANAEAEVRRAAALAGDSPEVLDQKLGDVRSAAEVGRVAAIARDSPITAFEYLRENRENIDPEQFNKLHDALEPVYYSQRAREWASGLGGVEGRPTNAPTGDVISYSYDPGEQQGPVRNKALSRKMSQSVETALGGLGLGFEVTSGGQDAQGEGDRRTGSTRHDHGDAADGYFTKNGKRLSWENPGHRAAIAEGIKALSAAGLTGFGAGPGYMAPGMVHIGFGPKAVWGAGGAGENAPEWLREAVASAADGGASLPQSEVGVTMADALAIEDPKMREAAIREVELRRAAYASDRKEKKRVANETAWGIVDEGGKPEDIPAGLASEVGVSTMNEIFTAYERNMQGVDRTDPDTWTELNTMAVQNPKAFTEVDLNYNRNELSEADRRFLLDRQLELKDEYAKIKSGDLSAVYKPSQIESDIGKFEEQFFNVVAGGSKTDASTEQRMRWPEMQRQMYGMLQKYAQDNGAAPSMIEKQAMFNSLMAPVVIEGVNDGLFGGDMRMFDVPGRASASASVEPQFVMGGDDPTSRVPPDEVTRIEENLSKMYGRQPTETEVIEQFENELLQSVGVDPTVEYDEIPKDIRLMLLENFPDASRDQLTDLYLSSMLVAAWPEGPGTTPEDRAAPSQGGAHPWAR